MEIAKEIKYQLERLGILKRLDKIESDLNSEKNAYSMERSRIKSLEDNVARLEHGLRKFQTAEEQLRNCTQKYEEEQRKSGLLTKKITELNNIIQQNQYEINVQEQRICEIDEQSRENYRKSQQELEKKEKKIADLIDENEKLKKNIRIMESDRIQVNDKVIELEKDKQMFWDKFNRKKAEIDKLRIMVQKKEEETDRLIRENDIAQEEISKLKEDLDHDKTKIEELKKRSQDLEEERDRVHQLFMEQKSLAEHYSEKFGCWEADTSEYKNLLKAVWKCGSLVKMLEDYGIDKEKGGENITNLLHFVGLLGNGTSFLPILYDYLEEFKTEYRQVLDSSERELISQLNSYYKREFSLSYDVILFPQTDDQFDKTTMKDIDARTKVFRKVESVYVPAIMRDETNFLLLALVKGV